MVLADARPRLRAAGAVVAAVCRADSLDGEGDRGADPLVEADQSMFL